MAKGGRGRGRGGKRRGNSNNSGTTSSSSATTSTTADTNVVHRRRGPPAIFITCEVGRERKCQREAIELIHHYYYNNSSGHVDDASLTKNETRLSDKDDYTQQQQQVQEKEEEPTLSLEEELAMLRKGAAPEEVLSYFSNTNDNNKESNSKRPRHTSTANGTFAQQQKRQKMNMSSDDSSSSMKSPFIIYDTGMRGAVCVVCTIPQCELIPYDKILSTIRLLNSVNNNISNNYEKNNGSRIIGSGIGDDDVDNGISKATKMTTTATGTYNVNKSETTKDLTTTSIGIVVNGSKLQEEGSKDYTTPLLWDPVETVRCIFHDAKKNASTIVDDTDSNNDTDAAKRSSTSIGRMMPPGSRYITRMIPIQATCYASIDEIKAVSISLLQRYLPNIYQSKRKKKDDNATTIISITFKIEIKKRLCTHLTQEQLINAIAPVLLLGGHDESGEMDAAGEGDGRLLVLPPKCKFEVNLTDPDFSIRIETCKTLCGVSILPRNDWYKKFNLAELTSPTTKTATEPNEEESRQHGIEKT